MTKFLLGFFSFGWLRGFDFLPPLLLRLFLAPLLWVSGSQKLGLFTSDYLIYKPSTWANPEIYQTTADKMATLPFIGGFSDQLPAFIGGLEIIGAFLLIIGFAVRWISIPLLALVALTAFTALNGQSVFAALNDILMTHGYTDMTHTSFGKVTIYFIMLLSLFFMGAGRFFSVDWFLHNKLNQRIIRQKKENQKVVKNPMQYKKEDPFDLDNTTD